MCAIPLLPPAAGRGARPGPCAALFPVCNTIAALLLRPLRVTRLSGRRGARVRWMSVQPRRPCAPHACVRQPAPPPLCAPCDACMIGPGDAGVGAWPTLSRCGWIFEWMPAPLGPFRSIAACGGAFFTLVLSALRCQCAKQARVSPHVCLLTHFLTCLLPTPHYLPHYLPAGHQKALQPHHRRDLLLRVAARGRLHLAVCGGAGVASAARDRNLL